MEVILGLLKPEYTTPINKVHRMFTEKLDELREKKKELGKYLIGISSKPWNEMKFRIGTPKDYKNYHREYHEITMGEEI